MQYRTLGRTGLQVSEIGLGTEYLLNQPTEVMRDVIATATAAGCNYMDILYVTHDFWRDFGPALRPFRHQWHVQAHFESESGAGGTPDVQQAVETFDWQLSELDGYADVALLSMMDWDASWDGWAQEALVRLKAYRDRGQVGYVAVGSHHAAVARRIVESDLVDVLMYPINLASHTVEGNPELYAACREHNVGLVAMKPYAGGMFFLAESSVFLHWVQAGGQALQVEKIDKITPPQCLAYVLQQPVASIVPGVKNVDELRQTLAYYDTPAAERDYTQIIQHVHYFTPGQCVYCNHCLPCAVNINIGETLRLLDEAINGVTAELQARYKALSVPASACIACYDCEQRCPYEVGVVSRMEEAAVLYE
ncbi:MAG: aldo/keto reductase [Anaerolineales bacterium]